LDKWGQTPFFFVFASARSGLADCPADKFARHFCGGLMPHGNSADKPYEAWFLH
jgi:hypothetical protein